MGGVWERERPGGGGQWRGSGVGECGRRHRV